MALDKTKIEELLKVDLLKELGLDNSLDDESKMGILENMSLVLMYGIWIRLFESLSDEKQAEFSELLSKNPNSVEAIAEFLKKEIPNYEDLIKEEIALYTCIKIW